MSGIASGPAGRPPIGVLALQGDVREHARALEATGAAAVPVRRESELARVAGLVIPGGESTAIERLLHVFGLFGPLRERIAAGLPVYGSCAGMILLASDVLGGAGGQRTLGGLDATVRRNAFGRQADSFETDLHVRGVCPPPEPPMRAVFIRAPWIEQAGPAVEVLATLPDEPRFGDAAGRIVVACQGPVLVTSFHPEVTGDLRIHAWFTALVREHGTGA